MKHFLWLLMPILLGACAGTPPEWWNPSGTYGNAPVEAVSSKNTVQPKTTVPQTQNEIPAEESIETSLDEYEELGLSATGEVENSEQVTKSVQETQTTADHTEQADPMYAPAEEHLPADGSLPAPSVLE